MSNRGPDLSGDYAQEGLPTADDYDPDALGTVKASAGEAEQEWPDFGLELVPIEVESKNLGEPIDTGRRMVMRNGNYLTSVSDRYQLLPNERAVGVANDVARDLGAEPFHEFDGDWFVRLDDHVFQDDDGRRVHALYAWDEGEIGDGDTVNYGFAVHNSIDGSLPFSVGLFSFRNACKNMVFMGTSTKRAERALNVERDREMLNEYSHRHTSGLEIDKDSLEAAIKSTLTLVDDVHATYQQWLEQEIEPEQIQGLLDRLPADDLPEWMQELTDALEHAAKNEGYEDEDEMPWERRAEVIRAEAPMTEPVWDVYNDITQNLWHRGGANDDTRRDKMKDVHRVMNPVAAGDSGVTVR